MPNSNSNGRLITELRENLVGLITIAVVFLVVVGMIKLNSRVRAYNAPAPADDLSGSDHHLYAATYQTTGGVSSTLGLNNTLNHELSAQVTLFNKHGQSLSTPAMNITLGAHKNHGFNIAEWAAGHDGFEEGSLLVSYHGRSMTLGAQETVTDITHGLNFDVHLSEYDDFMSSRVEGLWWGLDHQCDARVFIANAEDSLTTVTPFF